MHEPDAQLVEPAARFLRCLVAGGERLDHQLEGLARRLGVAVLGDVAAQVDLLGALADLVEPGLRLLVGRIVLQRRAQMRRRGRQGFVAAQLQGGELRVQSAERLVHLAGELAFLALGDGAVGGGSLLESTDGPAEIHQYAVHRA